MGMDRKKAARALRRIATLLELNGANPHRARAFHTASRAVERLQGDLEDRLASGAILEVPGIGRGTSAVLAELAAGQTPKVLAELEAGTPPGVLEMLELPGLGPKKVRKLWTGLGVVTLGELEYACRENRLLELAGFGPASQTAVLDALRFVLGARERVLVHRARAWADELAERIAAAGSVARVTVAGELRRGVETVGELSLVVESDHGEAARVAVLAALGPDARVDGSVVLGRLGSGLACRVRVSELAEAGAALLAETGPEEHLELLAARAATGGLELDAAGLRSSSGPRASTTEEEVYGALGVPWMPPELREEPRWLEQAAAGALPDLVAPDDLRGALHNHTTDSDGVASVAEMAAAAAARGWLFLGIADHSPAAVYAHGVDADRLHEQWRRIDQLNSRAALRILKGLEADILPDGRLDIPAGCEDGLEYVVASVHSSFRLAREAQTARLEAAVRHPACRVLGHPTGRLLLARAGYDIDLERVLAACAESGVVAEVNASPYRLDLDSHWARRALELGVRLAVNPDAHEPEGLDDVRWGLTVARRAGARAADLVNCADDPMPPRRR